MEIFIVVMTIIGGILIYYAGKFAEEKIWGPLTEKMNKKTIEDLDKFLQEEEERKKKKEESKKENKA